jgi:hypothetical protein
VTILENLKGIYSSSVEIKYCLSKERGVKDEGAV